MTQKIAVKKIFDYVIKLPTYKSINFKKGSTLIRSHYEPNFGCSAFSKKLKDGFVVARNMDWKIDNRPVFLAKFDIKNYHKAFTLCYANKDKLLLDWESIDNKKELDKDCYDIIPFISTDYFNEKGLYIETNIRASEKDEFGNSKWKTTGTNPGKERISIPETMIRMALKCATVDEALELIKNFDIFSIKFDGKDVPLGIMISDSKGDCGVLEILDNEINFTKTNIQTNFFSSKKHFEEENYPDGLGRFELLKENYDKVKTSKDALRLIGDVKYSSVYNPKTCKFSLKRELSTKQKPFSYWNDPANHEEFCKLLETTLNIQKYNSMTRQQLRDSYEFYETIYTSLVNCTKKTISVYFFEDENKCFEFDFQKEFQN